MLHQTSLHMVVIVFTSAREAEGVPQGPVVSIMPVVTKGKGCKEMGKGVCS